MCFFSRDFFKIAQLVQFFSDKTLRWSPSKVLCTTSVSMRNASVVVREFPWLHYIEHWVRRNWVNVSKETFWQTLTISSYKWLMTTKSIRRPVFFVIYSIVGFQVEKRSNCTVGHFKTKNLQKILATFWVKKVIFDGAEVIFMCKKNFFLV